MTKREIFIKALKREPITGLVPHFELVFYLTMEAFGRVHPCHVSFYQWNQMSDKERNLHIDNIADMYITIAEHYNHFAIFVQGVDGCPDGTQRVLSRIREKSGDKYFLMMHGDPTFSIPNGTDMLDFSTQLYENEAGMKALAARRVEEYTEQIDKCFNTGILDGLALCADYCFNVNPFFSPDMFSEFVTPYLAEITKRYHDRGYYVIKHTDGNIMPIIDQMVQCGPDALHSLDPQGGVSLAEVKRLYGDKVALCGNVNCALLQTGTEEECIADIRRSLHDGMDGYGYIFCTSNCVYTGMPLERYELMNRIWRAEGIYR
ncbi:MAG TPA: uroporphyrinogen decarboxylase family protein [Oscillospiraceae bacterium]|nr:uroporphyrinogen decarboxylase family protein [Oscillospiraceae bacterium]HPS33975.1 uroporphyrinogen decarboxylase family protein [Oscillospiraceae bacterium]